jgi:hypothetical protein
MDEPKKVKCTLCNDTGKISKFAATDLRPPRAFDVEEEIACPKGCKVPDKAQRVEPGSKWYYDANCRQCGERILLAEAPSPDDESFPKSGGVSIRCAHCGFESTYVGPLISRQPGPESK